MRLASGERASIWRWNVATPSALRLTGERDEHQSRHDDDRADDEPDHDTVPTWSLMGVAAVPQSAPPAQVSCFQIGADAFSVSIA